MGVIKFLEKLEYATDYDPDVPDGETRTEIPQTKIRQNESSMPGEDAQTQGMVSGHDAQAAAKLSGAFAVVIDDTDTFLDALVTAADDLTPVWFFAKPYGGNERVIGGTPGCLVTVNKSAVGDFGDFAVAVVAMNTASGAAGGTFDVAA